MSSLSARRPVGVMAHWVRCSTGSRTELSDDFVDEKDIIEGYDAAVMDAAGKLLACLETRGKKSSGTDFICNLHGCI